MAEKFILTAQLQLQSPRNVKTVVRNIRKELSGIKVPVEVNIKGRKEVQKLTKDLERSGRSAKKASSGISSFGKAVNQVSRDLTRIGSLLLLRQFGEAARGALEFERELIKVSQVTGTSIKNLSGLKAEIVRLSTSLGVSSKSLVEVSRVLSQTGISAKETRIALESLAKTTLAPTFTDIKNTTETAIAAMKQFKLEAKDLSTVLSQINSIAGQFAVEAGDIGVAIRRAGGVFQKAGGQLTELEALFTSVRSTTRESAETIATGFRTIFTRIQRPRTLKFLRQMGIELTDLKGKFIGPFEAVKRLSIALKDLDPRDIRFAQITEQLGGFRQVSKVIPLIKEFAVSQRALNVARAAGNSLDRDTATAQDALLVRLTKVKESFNALIRSISDNSSIKLFITSSLRLADALLRVTKALEPLLPLITGLATLGIAKGIGRLTGGVRGRHGGGRIHKFDRGGFVPGHGNGDTVPAMLQPGEFVIKKSSAQGIGSERLHGLNRRNRGGPIRRYGDGTGKRGVTLKPIKVKPPTLNSDGRVRGEERLPTPDEVKAIRQTGDPTQVNIANNVSAKAKAQAKETPRQKQLRQGRERRGVAGTLKLRIRENQYGGIFLNPQEGADRTVSPKSVSVDTGQKKYLAGILATDPKASQLRDKALLKRLIANRIDKTSLASVQFDASHLNRSLRKRIVQGLAPKTTDMISSLVTGTASARALKKIGLSVNKTVVKTRVGDQIRSGSFPLEELEGNVFESFVGAITGTPLSEKKASWDFPNLNTGAFSKLFIGMNPRLKHGEAKRTRGSDSFGKQSNNIGAKFARALEGKAGPANVSLKELGYDKAALTAPNTKIGQALAAQASGAKGAGAGRGRAAVKRLGGIMKRLTSGGSAGTDTVPALLTPGEFVINKGSSERIGYSRLNRMNKTGEFASGGRVGRYAKGGPVPTRGSGSAFGGTGERQAGGGFEKLFVLTAVAGQLSAQFEGMNEATKKLVDRLTQFAILLVALQAVGSPRKFAGAGVGTAGGGVFGIGRLTNEDIRGFAGSEGIDLREKESGKKAMKARLKARAGARAAKVEKIGGRTQLGFAAASAAALTFGESLKGAAQKSIQSARTEEEGSAAIGQASRAAAVSMGGLGAAIGAQFGPIGAVVGGVVGVLFGLVTAGEAARKQLETLKFKRQFEEFEKALVLAGKKGVDATTQSARISKGIADAQSRFFKAADDENIKELNNSLRRTLPTLDTYIQKVVSSAQSFEDLRRTVGDNVIKEFNRLTGQTLAQFRKQIEGEIEARKKSKEVQEKLSNAQEEVFRKVLLARGVASALTDLKAAAGSLVLGFKTIGQSLAGQFGRVEVFDALKGLGAPSEISDLQDFNQKISVATGIMGEAGIILGTEAKSFASVFANLPDILSQAVQQPVFEGDEGDLVAKVMKKIDGLGSVSELTRRRIQGQLEELAGGEDPGKLREAIRSDLNGLVKSLASGSSSIFKALQQGASFIDLSTKKFSSAFNQRTKAEALIAKRRLALSTFTLQKQQALAKATGTEINLEKIFNDFQTATNQLLAGTRVSNLGGNVDAIGDELARLKENIKKKRDEINDIPIDAGGENELRRRQKLIDETEKLQENFSKVSAALDRFANAQQRLGAVQKELSKEQKKRQQVFGAAAQFTFGGRDQRQQQQQAFFFTKLAAITGNINKVPDEFKGAVSGLLSQLEDIKLFGGQETGKEIKTRLVANQLRQLGVPPDLIKAITKRTSKEQDLIDKLRVVFEEAERARSAQLETLVDDRKRLLQDLRSLNRQLLTGLQKLLLGQAKRFEESEKTAIEDAKTRTEQGKASIQELRKLTTTDTGKELDDSQIETLRSQKGAFVEAQKAAKRNADSINSAVAFARQLKETNAGDRIVGESGIMQITGDAFGGAGGGILRSGEELEKVVDNIEKGLTRLFGAQFADDFVKEFRSKLTGAQKRGGRIDLSTVNKILVSQFTEFAKKTKETNDAIIQNASDLGTSLGFSAEQISRFTENANKINDVLSRIPIGATVTSLNSELIRLDTKLRQVNDNLEGIVGQQAEGGTAATPGLRLQTRSRGGIIYASDGGFTPRGTDVVPAMLSAGEFVVNKKATQANLPALQSMNSGGKVGYYQAGGVVDVPPWMQLGALGNGPTNNQLSDIYANGVKKLFDTLINEVGRGKVINPYWRHLGLSEGLPVEADRFNSNSLRGYADIAELFRGVPEGGETSALVFRAVKKALGNDPDTVPSLLLYGGQRRGGGREMGPLGPFTSPTTAPIAAPPGLVGKETGAIDENGFPLDLAEFRAREARGGRIFSTFGALRNSNVFGRGIDWPIYFGSEYSYDPEGTTKDAGQTIKDTATKLVTDKNSSWTDTFLLGKFSESGVYDKLSKAYESQKNYVNRFGANYLASNFGSEKAIKASRDENLADTLINDFIRLGLEPLQNELIPQILSNEGEDFYKAGAILGIGDFATLRGIGKKRSRSGVPYFGMDLPKDIDLYGLSFQNELERKIGAGLQSPVQFSSIRVSKQAQTLNNIADRPDTASLISSIYENYGIGSIAEAVMAEAQKQRKDQEVADAEIDAARMGNVNIASDEKLKAVIQNNIKRYRNDGTLGRLAGNPYGKVVPTVDKGDALSLIPTLISMRDSAVSFSDVLKKADRQSFEIDPSLADGPGGKNALLGRVNAALAQFPIYGGTRGKFELRSTKQILDGKIEGPLKVFYDGLITARQRLSADTGKGKIQFTGADGSIQEMFVQNAGAKDIYGYYGITKTEFRSYPIQKKKQLQNAFRSKQTAQTLSAGGPVYLAGGGFSPRGTDTVPAMLTPGEFVVNRKSTQANLPLLKSINSMSSGGVAYLAEGSGFNGALGLGLSRVDYVVEQERSRDELKGIKNELVVIKTVLIAQYSALNRSFKQLAFSIDPNSSGFSKFAIGAPMGAGAPFNPKFFNPSRGGHIPMYAKKGTLIPYEPKGTDTVPAMLTPGEFVIRKSAVDAIGVGNLQRLNSTGYANGGPVLGSVTGRPANLYTQRASGRTRKYSVAGTKGAGRQSWITHDMDIWKKYPKLRAEGQPEGFVYESAGRTTSRMKSQEEIDNMGFWAGAWEAAKRPDPSDLVNPMAFGTKGVTTLIGRLTRKVKHVRGIKQIRNLRAGATRGIKRVLKIGLGSTPDPVKTRPPKPDMGDYIYPEPEGYDESAFNIGQTMMRLLRGEQGTQHYNQYTGMPMPDFSWVQHGGRRVQIKDSPQLMKVGTRIRRSADAVGMQAGLTETQAGIQRGLVGSLAATSEEGASAGMAGMVGSGSGFLDISGVTTPLMEMNPSALGRGFHTHLSEGITELSKTNPELAQAMFKMHELVKQGRGTLDELLGGSLAPAGGIGMGIRSVQKSPKFAALANRAMKDTIQQEMMATYRHEIQHLYSKAYAAAMESGRYAREGGPEAVGVHGFAQEYSKASQNKIMDLFIPKGLDNTSSKGLNTLTTAQHGRTSRLHNLIESLPEFDRSMLYHYLFGWDNMVGSKQGMGAMKGGQGGRLLGAEPNLGLFREELASYVFEHYGSKGREGFKELAKVTGLGKQEYMYLIEHMTNIQRMNRAIGPIGLEGNFWGKSRGLFSDDFLDSPAGKDFKKFGPPPTGGPIGEFQTNESMIDILLNNPHTPGGKMGLPQRGVSGEEFFRRAGVDPFAQFDTSGGYVSKYLTEGERAPGTEWFLPRPSKTSQYIMGRPVFGRKHGGPVSEKDKGKIPGGGSLVPAATSPAPGQLGGGPAGRKSAYQHGETPLSASSKRTGGRRPTWEIWADTVLHEYRNRTMADLNEDQAKGLRIARKIDSGKLHGVNAFQAYRSVTGSRTRSRVLNYGVAGVKMGEKPVTATGLRGAARRRKALRKSADKGFGAASIGRPYHRLHDLGRLPSEKRTAATIFAHRSITGLGIGQDDPGMVFVDPFGGLSGAIPIGGVMPQRNVETTAERDARRQRNIAAYVAGMSIKEKERYENRKNRIPGGRAPRPFGTRRDAIRRGIAAKKERIAERRRKKARVKARGQAKRNMRRRRRGGSWRAKGGPVFDPRYKLGWSADRGMLRSQRETQSDEENADFSAYGEGVDPGWHQRQHFRRGLRRAFPDLWDMSIVKPRGKAPEFKLMPTDEMFGDTDRNQDPMSKSYLQDPRNRRRRAIQDRRWMEFQRRKKEALDKAKQKGVESWMRGSGPKVRNTPSRSRMITDPRLSRQGFNKGGGVGYFDTGGHISPLEKTLTMIRRYNKQVRKQEDLDHIQHKMRGFVGPKRKKQAQDKEQKQARMKERYDRNPEERYQELLWQNRVLERSRAPVPPRSRILNVMDKIKGYNKGGSVDTVPAMLTPGEFVINRQAATALGRSSLENINRAKGFNRGGAVKYLQAGGEVDGGMELSPLFNAITNLQSVLDGRLSELIKKIPLATEGTQNIFAIEDFRSSVDRLNTYSGFGLFHEAVSILAGIGPFQIEIPGGISVNLGAFEASLRVELKNIVMTAVKQAMGSLEIDMPDQGPDGRPNKKL